jgi:hypothetical protein
VNTQLLHVQHGVLLAGPRPPRGRKGRHGEAKKLATLYVFHSLDLCEGGDEILKGCSAYLVARVKERLLSPEHGLMPEISSDDGTKGSKLLPLTWSVQVMDVKGVGLKDLRGEALEFLRAASDLMQAR